MNNLPFTQNNNFNSNPLQQNQNFGSGYSNQYTPPPPSVTFSIIEGRVAVDNFLVGTNVTAILADFTNMKLYIPVDRRPSPYDAAHIPLNYRVLRYADVLLMKAEVENALGNDAEAQKALNQVRDRVNLDPVTSTGKALRDAIRLERRLELALEGNRLFDLRRWKDDNGKPAICNVMGQNGSFVRYNTVESTDEWEISNQNEASNKGYNFDETRDLLFPIPNSEITMSNGSIKQNPGYN